MDGAGQGRTAAEMREIVGMGVVRAEGVWQAAIRSPWEAGRVQLQQGELS